MENKGKRNFNGLLTFSFIAFWPIIIFMCFYIFAIALSVLLGPIYWPELIQLIGCVALAPAVIFICYRLCRKVAWKRQALLIWLAWLILALETSFLLWASVGGASMAVIEGKLPITARYAQYIQMSVMSALWMQIFIIPWTFLSIYLFKRIGLDKVFMSAARQLQ